MKVSANASILSHKMPTVDAIRLFAKAGFSTVDLTLCNIYPDDFKRLLGDYKSFARELKTVADSCGIVFNQSHAPFHSSYADSERTEKAYNEISRAMEFAALMGVENIVIHPKQHLEYPKEAEALKQMNLEFYNSLIPNCSAFGINILVENMWHQRDGHIIHSVCAHPQEFCEYIDMLNSPHIKACLDVGHAQLVGEDIPEFITGLGHRIAGLHIHDVAADNDLHTFPYFATIKNWDDIMMTLANVGYKGDLTFEIKPQRTLPDSITIPYLQLLHSVGEALTEKFNSFK